MTVFRYATYGSEISNNKRSQKDAVKNLNVLLEKGCREIQSGKGAKQNN